MEKVEEAWLYAEEHQLERRLSVAVEQALKAASSDPIKHIAHILLAGQASHATVEEVEPLRERASAAEEQLAEAQRKLGAMHSQLAAVQAAAAQADSRADKLAAEVSLLRSQIQCVQPPAVVEQRHVDALRSPTTRAVSLAFVIESWEKLKAQGPHSWVRVHTRRVAHCITQ